MNFLLRFLFVPLCIFCGGFVVSAQGPSAQIGYESLTYCVGDTGVFFNESTDYLYIDWQFDGTGLGDDESLWVAFDQEGTYVIELIASDDSEEDSDLIEVEVFPLPNPEINPPEDIDICEGSSVQLFLSENFAGYFWNTDDVVPSIFVSETGDYWVQVTDFNQCSAYSDTIHVMVNPDPDPTIEFTGIPVICEGDTLVLTTQNYDVYDWNTGDTTQVLNVTTGGFYAVEVTNEYGCSSQSNLVTVTLLEAPVPGISMEGGDFYCEEDSIAVTLFADSTWANIEWNTGETGLSIEVGEGGSYWYAAEGENGCWGNSDTLVIAVNTPIGVSVDTYVEYCPTISQLGIIEISISGGTPPYDVFWTGPSGYTSTSEDIGILDIPGLYTAEITDTNGCVFLFEQELATCTGINEQTKLQVSVYPSPSTGVIRFKGAEIPSELVIADVSGKIVHHIKFLGQLVDLSFLENGIYFLFLNGQYGWSDEKLIIQK
jgi:hypothetical protein